MRNYIKKYRKQARLSQQQLGERLGVTQATIGLYERSLREPSLVTIKKLADALNCKPTDLFPLLNG